MKKGIIKNNIINFFLLFFIVIVINILSEYKFFRIDLTAEKRYSLTETSLNQLKNLDDIVFFKVYLEGDDLNPGFKRLRNSLKEMLNEFIIYGGDNIQYEFINPNSPDLSKDKKEEIHKELYKRGLVPITLYEKDDEGNNSEKSIFPGVITSYKGRELAVDLLANNPLKSPEENLNNSVSELEYNLISTIDNLRKTYIPTIGFTTDHGELSNANTYSIKKCS
jgi:ABC-2 type transport system permease protein